MVKSPVITRDIDLRTQTSISIEDLNAVPSLSYLKN
jgi:hypothetical protein